MKSNSQALQNLVKSAESIEKENERLLSEILQRNLRDLNESLIASYTQSMNSIQSYITSELQERISPTSLKIKIIAMSFLSGMLLALILSGILWYQLARPYQVSRSNTKETPQGVFIVLPKTESIEQGGLIAMPIR